MLIYERNVNELKLKDFENLNGEKFCEDNLLEFKKQPSQYEKNTTLMIIYGFVNDYCRLFIYGIEEDNGKTMIRSRIHLSNLNLKLKKIKELLYVTAKRHDMETKKQRC